MKIFFTLFAVAITLVAKAQIVRQPLSVQYESFGAYSKNFADLFSGTSNQASLASLKEGACAVYGERKFMLAEVSNYAAIIAVPTPSGTIGFEADYFGSTSFNQTQLGLVYARKLADWLDVGVKFNYNTVRILGYGNASSINFEGGAIFHLSDKVHAGFHIYNPTSSKIGKAGIEKLAFKYVFGFGYEVSDQLFVSAEIVKIEEQPISINAGLQYKLAANVFLHIATSPVNNNTSAGFGLSLNFCRIDINAAYNAQLGFTPGLLLLVNLKKPKQE